MLKRQVWTEFEQWRNSKRDRGLLVTGARQVGKTYLVREFAKKHYKSFAEINLYENKKAVAIMDVAEDTEDFFARLSVLAGTKLTPGETLIFIDEIQESKEIVTAIKFLVQRYDFDFVLSGSLLGVELRDVRSVPVGYLDAVEMDPMNFSEYAAARGIDEELVETAKESLYARLPLPDYLHDSLLKLFYEYLIVGGMPAAVAEFVSTNDLRSVRQIQKNIISMNKWDISKYKDDKALLIKEMYEMIPAELNQQNKRFILKSMDERARFSRYRDSLVWLSDAGVGIPVFCAEEPVYPLKLSSSTNLFKLFLSDTGLLTSSFMKSVTLDILAKNPYVNYGAVYENVVRRNCMRQVSNYTIIKTENAASWIFLLKAYREKYSLLK
jgi:predicted AAA+ superfamily ATPase